VTGKKMCKHFGDIFLKKYAIITLNDENSIKVNSVQEACAKCFAVHTLKFEILQIT
jgi:hypothetical protein